MRPLRSDGEIWEEVNLARERGVFFDLGHGAASFGFGVAKGMLAKGFVPDVISSDVHALNIDGPVFDLMATLSKFYCLGLDLATLVRTATSAPAAALRRTDLGSLKLGSTGDATIFAIEEGQFDSPTRWAKSCAGNIGWRAAGSCRAVPGGTAESCAFKRGKNDVRVRARRRFEAATARRF
jgi:Predicted amidohydrolase